MPTENGWDQMVFVIISGHRSSFEVAFVTVDAAAPTVMGMQHTLSRDGELVQLYAGLPTTCTC